MCNEASGAVMQGQVFDSGLNILLQGEETIANKILLDIASGQLVSGDRLITTQLAQMYQTSINPVREALKQLQGEGFVHAQKNSGARVATFDYRDMRNHFEVLQLLEPYFLQTYAHNCSPQSIARLEQIQQKFSQISAAQSDAFRSLDTEFHWEMYKHHYNTEALRLWKHKKLTLLAMHGRVPIGETRFNATLKEHEHILYLLKAGDADAAVNALTRHVVNGGRYWSNIVKK